MRSEKRKQNGRRRAEAIGRSTEEMNNVQGVEIPAS